MAALNTSKLTIEHGAEFHLDELDSKLNALQANLAILSELVEMSLPASPAVLVRRPQTRRNSSRGTVICISTRRPVDFVSQASL
jgi:hypothetical protein